MKILFIGNRERLAALLNALSNYGSQGITHLADGTQAIAALSQGIRRYNWIILEDQALQGGGKDIAAAVRVMGSYSQDYPDAQGESVWQQWRASHGQRRCGVEWDARGVLQLHCCLQQRPSDDQGGSGYESPPGFIFEYHAPCRK